MENQESINQIKEEERLRQLAEDRKRTIEIYEEAKKRRQIQYELRKQTALKRKEEGQSKPGDCIYFNNETSNNNVMYKDEKIAHPDAMRKGPATALLIIGMIGSLIFKQWYLVWIILFLWYFHTDRV